MVGQDFGSYTFNAATRQITLSGLPVGYNVGLNQILLITNVSFSGGNTIIYVFNGGTTMGGSIANNVITLDYNTTSMSNSDILQIYIDVEFYDETLAALLRRMNKLLESNAVVDSNLRQRVAVETMPASVAVTLASAPTTAVTIAAGQGPLGAANANFPSLTQPGVLASQNVQFVQTGPIDHRWEYADRSRISYANAIRVNLVWV